MELEVLDRIIAPIVNIDINDVIARAIMMNEAAIIRLNQSSLAIGEDTDGESLGDYSSFSYKNRWRPVDLFKTGEYWRDMSVVIASSNDAFYMVDSNEKSIMLSKRYGKAILGIPKEGVLEVGEIIKEDMSTLYREQL